MKRTSRPPEPRRDASDGAAKTTPFEHQDLLAQQAAEDNAAQEHLRRTNARAIERHLSRLESHIRALLTKYTDRSISAEDPDLDHRLFEWSQQFARGEVPDEFKGSGLEKDSAKARDLHYYALLVCQIRLNVDHGLGWALPTAKLFDRAQEVSIRSKEPGIEQKPTEAEEHHEDVDLLKVDAARGFNEALPKLLEALRLTTSLLASMDPEHLIRGARMQRHLQEVAERDYRRAAVDLFRRIIDREGIRDLAGIWRWAGTSYYRTVDRDGALFTFRRQGDELVISVADESGSDREVRRQKFVRSTLYEWRAEALKASLDSL